MYDRETTSRLGYGPRIGQLKPEKRISRRPRADGKRLAAAATRSVYKAARYSPARGRASGSALREGESEDDAKGDDMTARLADETADEIVG